MSYRQRLSLLIITDSVIILTAIFLSRFLMGDKLHVITLPLVVSVTTILLSHHFFPLDTNCIKRHGNMQV